VFVPCDALLLYFQITIKFREILCVNKKVCDSFVFFVSDACFNHLVVQKQSKESKDETYNKICQIDAIEKIRRRLIKASDEQRFPAKFGKDDDENKENSEPSITAARLFNKKPDKTASVYNGQRTPQEIRRKMLILRWIWLTPDRRAAEKDNFAADSVSYAKQTPLW